MVFFHCCWAIIMLFHLFIVCCLSFIVFQVQNIAHSSLTTADYSLIQGIHCVCFFCFTFLFPPPVCGAVCFTWFYCSCAWCATNVYEAFIVQSVIGNIVFKNK